MAGFRVLADGKTKLTFLTTKPANPAAPTATELNAGLDVSCKVLADDFKWSATASERVGEQALCDDAKSETPGIGNYDLNVTMWRFFATGGGFDATDDAAFEAVKDKGTTLWGYARRTDKASTEVWAATDEIYLGAEVVTDTPQVPGNTGFIKYTVPLTVAKAYDFIAVAGA